MRKTTPWGKATMYSNADIGPEDATYPIPQRQIDLSNGKLIQLEGHYIQYRPSAASG